MHQHGTRVRIPRDNSPQISPQRYLPRVPVVMRDRDAGTQGLSAELEEELEVQHTLGRKFFLDVIRAVMREAIDEIEREDEEEDRELSDESEN